MWYENATLYQIYPLGACGAPKDNDGVLQHRSGTVSSILCRI